MYYKGGGTGETEIWIDGQLITNRLQLRPKIIDGFIVSDPDRGILKIIVVNRYHDTPPAIGTDLFGNRGGIINSKMPR